MNPTASFTNPAPGQRALVRETLSVMFLKVRLVFGQRSPFSSPSTRAGALNAKQPLRLFGQTYDAPSIHSAGRLALDERWDQWFEYQWSPALNPVLRLLLSPPGVKLSARCVTEHTGPGVLLVSVYQYSVRGSSVTLSQSRRSSSPEDVHVSLNRNECRNRNTSCPQ